MALLLLAKYIHYVLSGRVDMHTYQVISKFIFL